MINATVVGNLGSAAELRQAGSTSVASFRVASTTKVKGQDQTTWVSVSLFGERAEKLVQYLTKGKKVAVSGQLSTREYESNGQKRTSVELRADNLEFLSKDENGASTTSKSPEGLADDEIPF